MQTRNKNKIQSTPLPAAIVQSTLFQSNIIQSNYEQSYLSEYSLVDNVNTTNYQNKETDADNSILKHVEFFEQRHENENYLRACYNISAVQTVYKETQTEQNFDIYELPPDLVNCFHRCEPNLIQIDHNYSKLKLKDTTTQTLNCITNKQRNDSCENCFKLKISLEAADKTIHNSNEKITEMKHQIQLLMNVDFSYLKESDSLTKYLTGISSYTVLIKIFNLVENDLIESPKNFLTKIQMFMLTLKRLRLNHQLHTLAIEYQISQKCLSKYYHSTLYTLYMRLKNLIYWPERNILKTHMPESFKKIYQDRVTVIIDCFEIKMERPANMLASCNVFSNYKSTNTIKVLYLY